MAYKPNTTAIKKAITGTASKTSTSKASAPSAPKAPSASSVAKTATETIKAVAKTPAPAIKQALSPLPKADVNYASGTAGAGGYGGQWSDKQYGKYTDVNQIYEDVRSGKITAADQARELGAIARGENANISQSNLEQQQRTARQEWERANPTQIDPLSKQINDMIDAGTAQFIQTATGGQYVDMNGNVIGTLANGTLTKGGQPVMGGTGATGQVGGTFGTGGTGVTNNTGLINEAYEAQKQAALAALRQAIQKARGGYESTIASAGQTFNPLKEQANVAAAQNLARLRESMAEQGQAGGISRSEETAVQASAQNQINALNQQQQNVISEANKAITDLEASGQLEQAQLVAENANNKIRALIEESNRVASETYKREQDTLDRRLQSEQIAKEEKRYQEAKTADEQDRIRKDYASSINPLDDQTAIIQRLKAQGVPDSDYRIIEHQKVRVGKLQANEEAKALQQAQAIKDEKERQEFAIEWAWKRFEAGLPADKLTADLFNVPVGSVIPAQRAKDAQLALARQREARVASNAGRTSSGLTQNQALTQARQILGEGASAQDITALATQLRSGNVSGTSTSTPQKSAAKFDDFDTAIKSSFDEFDTPDTRRKKAADFIGQSITSGTLSVKDAERLAVRYGVSEKMIQDYVDMQKFKVMNNL